MILIGLLLLAPSARAQAILPYSTRTHAYSGYDTTIRGDLRAIGMAGAMVGLADSLTGSLDNPAGLAMTVDGIAISGTRNTIHDGYLQSQTRTITSDSFGMFGTDYPWGFSATTWVPAAEGDTYHLLTPTGEPLSPEVRTREYRFTAARLIGERVSLGLSLIFGENTQRLGAVDPGDVRFDGKFHAVGAAFGGMLRLPGRMLLGASYTLPMSYDVDAAGTPTVGILSFFQPVRTPYRLAAGAGWVPNRFFRAAVGVYLVGASPDVALLSDDAKPVGNAMSIQPRGGISYRLAEYREFEADLAAGMYLEVSRVEGAHRRVHGTAALELKPWIFNLGWGLDGAEAYQNLLYTFGVDIGLVLRKLKLVPPEPRPPLLGLLPNPAVASDTGLPRPLVKDRRDAHTSPGVFDIGKQLPEKLLHEIQEAPRELRDFKNEVMDTIEELPQVPQKMENEIKDRLEQDP